jgi:tetratricopeptide (TPR) repeat protein
VPPGTYSQLGRDPTRTILSVLAAPIADEQALWPFLRDVTRIEAPGPQAYLSAEAVRRTLLALAVTPQEELPAPAAPQPAESAAELVTRGKVLLDQEKHAEALPLFEVATRLDPDSFSAWFNLGYTLAQTKGSGTEQLAAYERAIALSPTDAAAWTNTGAVLADLKRYAEALEADERAISLDPTDALTWLNKGTALAGLQRYEEALAAYARATTLDPAYALAWTNTAIVLRRLGRLTEANATEARARASTGA